MGDKDEDSQMQSENDDSDFFDDSVLDDGEFMWNDDKPKAAKVTSVVMDTNQIIQKQRAEVMEVANVLSVSQDEAMKLCVKYNWKIEQLLESFFDKGEAGQGERAVSSREPSVVQETYCNICTETDCPKGFWRHPACGVSHRFCVECWGNHVSTQIKDGQHLIPCMAGKCANVVSDADFIRTLVRPETYKLYEYLVAKAYVRTHKQTRWCPNPNCKKAVFTNDASVSVTCECGTTFCVKCGNESHTPVGCEMLREWQSKLATDGTSMEWVRLFSKPCPNTECQMPIQKDGGCQFMNCTACRAPFCWECMKLLSKDHEAHNCQKKQEADDKPFNKSKNELQDYSDCSKGFDTYMANSKTYTAMRPVEKKKQQEYDYMMKDSFSNFRFYEDALDILIEASRITMYSFIFQFYSREHPSDFELFIFNQKALVEEIKGLEAILKRDTVEEKDRVVLPEKSRVVKIRMQAVLRSVEEGLTKNADLYRIRS